MRKRIMVHNRSLRCFTIVHSSQAPVGTIPGRRSGFNDALSLCQNAALGVAVPEPPIFGTRRRGRRAFCRRPGGPQIGWRKAVVGAA
jgi:hypothetical protein